MATGNSDSENSIREADSTQLSTYRRSLIRLEHDENRSSISLGAIWQLDEHPLISNVYCRNIGGVKLRLALLQKNMVDVHEMDGGGYLVYLAFFTMS